MKRLLTPLLALLLTFSLAACGGDGGESSKSETPQGGNTTPTEGYDAEYTIYVNGVDEWTPFQGKNNVVFDYSGSVISISDNGSTANFTGKQVGEAVVKATSESIEKTALVRVRAMAGEDTTSTETPLIRALPASYYIAFEYTATTEYAGTCYEVFTGTSYSLFRNEKDGDGYMDATEHYTPFGYYQSGYGEWFDNTAGTTYVYDPAGKFQQRSSEEGMFWETLCTFRRTVIENQISGTAMPTDISNLYTGKTEVIAGIECKVYQVEDKTHKHGLCTFWVEPDYHFCLKYENPEYSTASFVITDYTVPYDGENTFVPPSYEGLPGL